MSYAIFIKMDSITGESRDAKHKGEIDVLSWSWGVTNHPSEIAGKVGAVSGKASSSDLNFSHSIDLASPSLIKACASGRHLKEALVTVQKAVPAAARIFGYQVIRRNRKKRGDRRRHIAKQYN